MAIERIDGFSNRVLTHLCSASDELAQKNLILFNLRGENMKCRICQNETKSVLRITIRKKYIANLHLCSNCKLLQVENPFWLEEAYASPINITDTGILQRNIGFIRRISPILYYCFDKKASFLDYAGGYGIFTRLMRDVGFNYYWQDKYATNMLCRGFEQQDGIHYQAITLFEYLEHSENPLNDLDKIFTITENLIFSTNLYGNNIPDSNWWYYGTEHGQHISFYSKETLSFLAKKYGKVLVTDGFLHAMISPTINLKMFNDIFFRNKITGNKVWKILSIKEKIKYFIPYLLGSLKLNANNYINMTSLTFSDHLILKNSNNDNIG